MTRPLPREAPAAKVSLRRSIAAVGSCVVAACSLSARRNGQPHSFAVAAPVQLRASASTAAPLWSQREVSSAAKRISRGRSGVGYTVSLCALAGGVAARARRRQQRLSCGSAASGSDAVDGAAATAPLEGTQKAAPKDVSSASDQEKAGDGDIISQLTGKWNSLSFDTREDIKTFVTSLTIALSFRAIFVEPRFIPSLSMYPTFDIGDQLTVDKISRNWRDFQRRDVVVFNPPPAFNEVTGIDRSGEALIKRIVAIEGDVVEVKNRGVLFINGERQEEAFTNENAAYNFGPVTVPKGCVFVLGDNRNQSLDGHIWGFLPKENIIGRATLKFWPPWRVGSVQAAPP